MVKNREGELKQGVTGLDLYLSPEKDQYNLRSSFAVGSPSPRASEVGSTGEALAPQETE